MRIDLCCLGTFSGTWPLGEVVRIEPTIDDVAAAMQRQANSAADATLFWDPSLGAPPVDARWFAGLRADVVHAGLRLGTAGAPTSIDFIAPTWMWSADPSPDLEATSWRLSLRACFIKHDVIRTTSQRASCSAAETSTSL